VRGRVLLLRLALICGIANLGGGACAGGCCTSEETARYGRTSRDARRQELEAFVFRRPIGEVWPELIGVLAEHGYALSVAEPVEGRTLETSFKPAIVGEYRMLVRVNRLDGARYRLSVEKQYRHLGDAGVELSIESHDVDNERVDMLWSLIERVEPERAIEMTQRVQEKAERAAAVGRGCDRGCAACTAIVSAPLDR
jgi:hypothetical protein